MDPLTFANNLASKQETEPQLDRWAHKYLETSALQTLHVARYINEADKDTQQEYLNVLATVLERLPQEVHLEISRSLFETLEALLQGSAKELLRKHVGVSGALINS
jgi:hypothetical protein